MNRIQSTHYNSYRLQVINELTNAQNELANAQKEIKELKLAVAFHEMTDKFQLLTLGGKRVGRKVESEGGWMERSWDEERRRWRKEQRGWREERKRWVEKQKRWAEEKRKWDIERRRL